VRNHHSRIAIAFPALLVLDRVSVGDPPGRAGLVEASLSVHAGEIVGIAGVSGNGQSALAGVIAGTMAGQGTITLARGKWDGTSLVDVKDIFSAIPSGNASRIVFGKDGMLYMTVGVGDPQPPYLNLASQPEPFAQALAPLQGKFEHWNLRELRSVHQTMYEVESNWKLFFHNYSECYHCPNVHPHLNKLTPYKNTENDLDEGPVLGGPMWMSNPEGSMTMDGNRCALPFAGLTAEERGRVYYYTLFPSAFLSFHPDYVLVHRAQPLAVGRTRIRCDWFFHPDAIAAPGFDPQPAIDFWDLTNRQDWDLCANAYLGVSSKAWEPGMYADIESQLAAFDRQYLRAMGELPPRDDAAQGVGAGLAPARAEAATSST